MVVLFFTVARIGNYEFATSVIPPRSHLLEILKKLSESIIAEIPRFAIDGGNGLGITKTVLGKIARAKEISAIVGAVIPIVDMWKNLFPCELAFWTCEENTCDISVFSLISFLKRVLQFFEHSFIGDDGLHAFPFSIIELEATLDSYQKA